MSKSDGRIWPYAIGGAITLVFGFCVATIIVTGKANIQDSDEYMTHYQEADANANELIESRIEFDKKYKIEYLRGQLQEHNTTISYRVSDIDNNIVNSAKLILAISRPETSEYNKKLTIEGGERGVYSFENLSFEKEGVWNLIVKVSVADKSRFYNIKADTRSKNSYEF